MQNRLNKRLWRSCNLTSFSPCLTGPVDYLFASRYKGPRFKSPGGYLCESGILLLAMSRYIGDPNVIDHHGLVWGGLHPKTITRPSHWLCDNPTWSHTAFLSRFHARCRSPFRLHNRRSWLLGGSLVESLQSHYILTMSHWSSEQPVCFPSQGTQVQIPWGVLVWNRDSLVGLTSTHIQLGWTLYFISAAWPRGSGQFQPPLWVNLLISCNTIVRQCPTSFQLKNYIIGEHLVI
jgi:hypothetical protein